MSKTAVAEKKTIQRVMHEYKHHDLTSGSGDKVKSRKQAIAIALKEAGASRRQKAANENNKT